ncbi:MAG: methyltransferase domain-containing protein [Candidatus Thermoplasmatota archaeon]|nr:methyltransferase domain-containing protein [Candidatus Thermoplasmatota archaeon]MDA8142868.1 methyltransferase domain-containing protein [Thermoplasmatales archaeon]
MAILILKSRKMTGILDTITNRVTLGGRTFSLSPQAVLSPGDTLKLQGDEFLVLTPSPHLFRDYAKRSAQIIQPWDVASIIFHCSIKEGSRVLESGAGSGALTTALISAVGKSGQVTTVELDKKNIDLTRKNLDLVFHDHSWNAVNGNISTIDLDGKYDAVILDIPEPWNSIDNVRRFHIPGGRLCCYSPTYNQLEKNVAALTQSGYYVEESFELIKRDILVRDGATRPDNDVIGHTAFLTFAVKLSGIVMKN